jgi:hypothetical protein
LLRLFRGSERCPKYFANVGACLEPLIFGETFDLCEILIRSNRYDGEWKNGLKEGTGVMDFSSGNRYEGMWKEGSMDGHGIFTGADGHKYGGAFKAGALHGRPHVSPNSLSMVAHSGVWLICLGTRPTEI